MFNQLADRFDTIFRNLRGLGKITDANIQQTSREIRSVLLEADVNFKVAKAFVSGVKDRAEGTKVLKSVKPGEQFIKIIHDELVNLLGKEAAPLGHGGHRTTGWYPQEYALGGFASSLVHQRLQKLREPGRGLVQRKTLLDRFAARLPNSFS